MYLYIKYCIMNIKKIYFWLVSLISIIALSVSLWIILTSFWKKIFISDNEYIQVNNWQLNDCKYNLESKYCWWNDLKNKKCALDIKNNKDYKTDLESCKKSKKEEIILKRHYGLKITLISSWSTFIVFLLLFIFHYLRFKKLD